MEKQEKNLLDAAKKAAENDDVGLQKKAWGELARLLELSLGAKRKTQEGGLFRRRATKRPRHKRRGRKGTRKKHKRKK